MALPPPAAPPIVPPVGPPIIPQWQIEATTLGLDPDEAILYELMTNFHSFTQDQYIALKEQGGYSTLADLDQWQHKDIKDWCVAQEVRTAFSSIWVYRMSNLRERP